MRDLCLLYPSEFFVWICCRVFSKEFRVLQICISHEKFFLENNMRWCDFCVVLAPGTTIALSHCKKLRLGGVQPVHAIVRYSLVLADMVSPTILCCISDELKIIFLADLEAYKPPLRMHGDRLQLHAVRNHGASPGEVIDTSTCSDLTLPTHLKIPFRRLGNKQNDNAPAFRTQSRSHVINSVLNCGCHSTCGYNTELL